MPEHRLQKTRDAYRPNKGYLELTGDLRFTQLSDPKEIADARQSGDAGDCQWTFSNTGAGGDLIGPTVWPDAHSQS